MESSNYCSLDLPKYIDFSKVLTYVEEKVGKKTFEEILKNKKRCLLSMKVLTISS